jgi:tetratricopeptide (TPR) repeat protein
MKRTIVVGRPGAALLVGLLFLVSGSPSAQEGPGEPASLALRSRLEAIPLPDLSRLDRPVALQLEQARSEMETTIADPTATPVRLAAAYGTLGQLYHAYEFFHEALACYRNASTLAPQDYRWHHLQGDALRLLGKLEEATGEFEAAWSLEQNDFAALVALGEISLDLGRDDDAERSFRAALAMSPGSPSVMAGLGELALRRRDYEGAVAYFRAALASVPEANRLHYSLAMAYRGLGDMDRAKEHLAQRGTVGLRAPDPVVDSLQLLTRGERVHLVRGRMAYASDRVEEARDEFAQAVDADPSSVRALVNLGTAEARLGHEDRALELFRRALDLEPKHATASFNLGSLLASREAFEEAIPYLREVVAQAPQDAHAQLLLARSLVGVGDDYGSLAHFEQAAKLDPTSEDAVVGGAAALVDVHQYHRARSVLEAGAQRLPSSGRIAFALARLLAACPDGEVRDGEQALDLAQKVYGTVPSARHAQLVAQAMAELNRCGEAAQWQQKVVDAAVEDDAEEVLPTLRADLELYLSGPPCRPPLAP